MKLVLSVLIVLLVYYLAKSLIVEFKSVQREQHGDKAETKQSAPAEPVLPGLPPGLEPSLQAAEKQGVDGLKNWLKRYRFNVSDPRLASIELDYVMLLSARDPVEAKRLFKEVKDRTPQTSPLYPRIKSLEKTFD